MIEKFFYNSNKKYKCVIVAMDSELEPILKTLKSPKLIKFQNRSFYIENDIFLIKSGIGEINAGIATEFVINLLGEKNIDFIINVGLCGSLNKEKYKIGDILMVKNVIHYDFDLSKIDNLKIGQYPDCNDYNLNCDISYFNALKNIYGEKIKLVNCASGDKFIADKDFQKFLSRNFNADICEMEAAGIILTSKKHNINSIFIKAISDIIEDENSEKDFLDSTKTITKNYLDALFKILNDELPKRITSFNINHKKLFPGFYTSRIDDDIFTYDLRFKIPNHGDYIPLDAMHTIEHQMATFLRNSEMKHKIIYFGAMACGTGFYLLVRDLDYKDTKILVASCLEKVLSSKEVFGATEVECGNAKNHNLPLAKVLCKKYLEDIKKKDIFLYEE